MGFGGIGPGSLLIILVIVILLFGTKKLKNMGGDIGGAFRNFKNAMSDGEKQDSDTQQVEQKDSHAESGDVIEGEVESKDKDKDKDKV
ncbi:MAG: hypothetical protein BMS9Abin26_1728 [Gammaproteobacteria bacterium]|nr:MAG: hypothetical protein BMS9Abin26_1728 [Gammaproteobacteria bacterium]